MKKSASASLKEDAKGPRLSSFKGILTRDRMKKITGGYIVCNGPGWPCPQCQYQGQFFNDSCGH